MSEPQSEQNNRFPAAFLAGLVVMVILVGVVWLLSRQTTTSSSPAQLPFGDTEKAYARRIHFKDIQMGRAVNFLGHEVTVISGTIENVGNQDILEMTIAVEFRDFAGQVVLREEVRYPDTKMPRISASGQRDFVFNFEKVPATWSQQYPQFLVTGLRLER